MIQIFRYIYMPVKQILAQLLILFSFFVNIGSIEASAGQVVHFNQEMIEEVEHNSSLDLTDQDAVFEMIFTALPSQIKIYPSEGYYYFWFYHHGNLVRGNLRFAYDLIDKGELAFAYYISVAKGDDHSLNTQYKVMKPNEIFSLSNIDPNEYLLRYKDKSVKVSMQIPKSDFVETKEFEMIGDMHDESGLVFTLVFDQNRNVFYYILDQSRDYEYHFQLTERLSVGSRTGFVFYQYKDKKILVGVNLDEIKENSFFDGPFDQLPEYALEAKDFKSKLALAFPNEKGLFNDHGQYIDNTDLRVAITNYITYVQLQELVDLEKCATSDAELTCVQQYLNKTFY